MTFKQPNSKLKTRSRLWLGSTQLTPESNRYRRAIIALALTLTALTGVKLSAATDTAIVHIEVRLAALNANEIRQLSTFCESQIASSDQCEKIDELFRYSAVSDLSAQSSEEDIRNYLGRWLNSADLRTLEPCDFELERLDDGSLSLVTVTRE